MEIIINKWNASRRRIDVLARENPKEALNQIPALDELGRDIVDNGKKLFDEINKHIQNDISPMYKEMELTAREVKQVRALALTLNFHLGDLVNPIQKIIQNQEFATMERSIRLLHPEL